MIRTVKIPSGVSRMGCTPGGDCCSECAGKTTGPPIGAAAYHVHALLSGAGRRNEALHARLGATACDQDGNCYDTTTGELLSAPLTTGPGCPPGVMNCSSSSSGFLGMNSTTTFIVAGLGLIALLELFTRRK